MGQVSSAVQRLFRWYLATPAAHIVALVGLIATIGAMTLGIPGYQPFNPYRIDIDVYRLGGLMLLEGRPLYGQLPLTEVGSDLPFTYPPIAAAIFVVFALMPLGWASFLLTLITCLATVAVVWFVLRVLTSLRGRPLLVATTAVSIPMIWLDPVHQTLDFGQINVLLMLLVATDVLAGRGRRWRGVFTGLAIAIKLTPAVFLAFFLVRRDWRALATALVSTLAWTGLGFLIRPADSVQYWTETLANTSRIGLPGYSSNQSLNGLISRLLGDDASRLWWFLGCAVVGLFVLALIHRLGDDEVAGLAAMGLYSLFASPISWSHHWVWMVPTVLVVLRYALRGGWAPWAWLAAGAATLFVGPQWWWYYEEDAAYYWTWWQQILCNAWLWLLLAAYAIFWVYARRGPGGGRPEGAPGRDRGGDDSSEGSSPSPARGPSWEIGPRTEGEAEIT